MGNDRLLYWASDSPPCWRVKVLLAEKQLDYESKQLSFSDGEAAALTRLSATSFFHAVYGTLFPT